MITCNCSSIYPSFPKKREPRILHMTLKKKWFDMILSGEKNQEYREIKDYWKKRLTDEKGMMKIYDFIRFKNGYQKNAPQMDVEYMQLYKGPGRKKWGGEDGEEYFVLQLGDVFNKQNCN